MDLEKIGAENCNQLLEVWEAAVRATHHFLSESDIQSLRPLVLPALLGLEHLLGVRDAKGNLVAFVGVTDEKMDALFVHPSQHRVGIGRRLVKHAVVELGVKTVDVNEQNEQAVAFYLRLGFKVEGRSELDSSGHPFPLVHLRLEEMPDWIK
jgi:putative acetyltransferase